MPSKKSILRQQLRQRRRSLSRAQQQAASRNLLKTLITHPAYRNSRHIAVYLARDGEIDPGLLVEDAWRRGKQIYLPVIDPLHRHTLTFLPWRRNTVTVNNRFGIPEPDPKRYRAHPAWCLDLVLLPLTGFDTRGRRMGMGGGYYDRTFSFIRQGTRSRQPTLIGLAHECQKVGKIPVDSWDIPLSGIATDCYFYC